MVLFVVFYAAFNVACHIGLVMYGWEWFLEPLGVPALGGVAHGLGISAFLHALLPAPESGEVELQDTTINITAPVGLLVIWVIHLFM